MKCILHLPKDDKNIINVLCLCDKFHVELLLVVVIQKHQDKRKDKKKRENTSEENESVLDPYPMNYHISKVYHGYLTTVMSGFCERHGFL